MVKLWGRMISAYKQGRYSVCVHLVNMGAPQSVVLEPDSGGLFQGWQGERVREEGRETETDRQAQLREVLCFTSFLGSFPGQ